MPHQTSDLRIAWTKVLLPPCFLQEELPATNAEAEFVANTRVEICNILRGQDQRLLVVVGPCSIHDPEAAREYAALLKTMSAELSSTLCLVMRAYFEKPRTIVGWKGLINDPYLDGSFGVNQGLRIARHLLLDLAKVQLPAGSEFVDPITPQYLVDLVSWGAIGARTSESPVHRQLASGLSCPIGFKNGTSGDVQIAIDAIQSAAYQHCFLGHTNTGQSAIFGTYGNMDCHLILRGGRSSVNYTEDAIALACLQLENASLPARLMVDCSHANCGKDHKKQAQVCEEVIAQIAAGEKRIVGVMLESNLVAGSQLLTSGKKLVYGQSITDPCLGWEETAILLRKLSQAVTRRRFAGRSGEVIGSNGRMFVPSRS